MEKFPRVLHCLIQDQVITEKQVSDSLMEESTPVMKGITNIINQSTGGERLTVILMHTGVNGAFPCLTIMQLVKIKFILVKKEKNPCQKLP